MLWIALHLPRLSLDVIERVRSHSSGAGYSEFNNKLNIEPGALAIPIAICNHLEVLSVNQCALDAGVTPGSRRASAQALVPDIELIAHDPVREQQALTSLACWALQFTPSVGFAPAPLPDRKSLSRSDSAHALAPLPEPGQAGLLLEVAASLRLFGGLPALLSQLHQGLQDLSYQAHLGIASTCHGAWLLAKSQPLRADSLPEPLERSQNPDLLMQRLAALPISLLTHAAPHQSALRAIGTQTLGDLIELPRAGIARRFGKKLLLEVDAALGSHPQPIGYFKAPEQFAAKLELMADVERTEALLYAARRLIIELTGWLSARHAGVRSFDLVLEHNTPPQTSLSVRLTNISRDPQRLVGLLQERLNVLQLRTSVHTLHLLCSRIQPMAMASQTLFDSQASTQESLGRLLERLQGRLGREQVQRLYLAQDHRPEAAYEIRVIDKLEDFGKSATPLNTHNANNTVQNKRASSPTQELFCASTGSLPRPLWLLREPSQLAERNNRPWLNSSLTVLAGPERIETGWWDTHLIQRDYFVAEDDTNTLYWIFRDRRNGWFVHGRFG